MAGLELSLIDRLEFSVWSFLRLSSSKTVYFRALIAAGHACGYLVLPNDSGACRPSWTCFGLVFVDRLGLVVLDLLSWTCFGLVLDLFRPSQSCFFRCVAPLAESGGGAAWMRGLHGEIGWGTGSPPVCATGATARRGPRSQSKTVYFRALIAAGHACGYLVLPNDSGACRPSWTCFGRGKFARSCRPSRPCHPRTSPPRSPEPAHEGHDGRRRPRTAAELG